MAQGGSQNQFLSIFMKNRVGVKLAVCSFAGFEIILLYRTHFFNKNTKGVHRLNRVGVNLTGCSFPAFEVILPYLTRILQKKTQNNTPHGFKSVVNYNGFRSDVPEKRC